MKNTILLFLLVFACGSVSLLGQATNPPPDPWASSTVIPNQSSLLVAFEIMGPDAPAANTTDWVAAVDADDANDLLGFSRADINSQGRLVASPQVNEPTGASNSFHLVFWDESEQTFHILNDATNSPLTIVWEDDNPNDFFVDGYNIGNNGAFPGEGMPSMPGQTDFASITTFLPVELTLFTGTASGKQVALNWATASEEANDFFAVERSADGVTFAAIGRVDGRNEAATYDFTDEQPATGVSYYRLGQTDLDGTVNHSEVIAVAVNTVVTGAAVFPNPARTVFSLQLEGQWKESVQVTLLDHNGRALRTWGGAASGLNELYLPAMAPGLYRVRATDGERLTTTTLLINQ